MVVHDYDPLLGIQLPEMSPVYSLAGISCLLVEPSDLIVRPVGPDPDSFMIFELTCRSSWTGLSSFSEGVRPALLCRGCYFTPQMLRWTVFLNLYVINIGLTVPALTGKNKTIYTILISLVAY